MQDHPTNRAEQQTSARILAIELNNRAWELIERQTRTIGETIEMLDAAHGGRAWRSSLSARTSAITVAPSVTSIRR
jgi:hypothetical protein